MPVPSDSPIPEIPSPTFVWNRKARRYILRVHSDGSVRVTIPRGGTRQAAVEFVARNTRWLRDRLERHRASAGSRCWNEGAEFLFRGNSTRLRLDPNGTAPRIHFDTQWVPVPISTDDWRPVVEQRLRDLAARELPARTLDLARQHELAIRRVTVRDQRSRWGSCSVRRTISLNWRLIQTPDFVRDYIIIHELMHLREMNHSPRFWRHVAQACPSYREAELWLRKHSRLLRE